MVLLTCSTTVFGTQFTRPIGETSQVMTGLQVEFQPSYKCILAGVLSGHAVGMIGIGGGLLLPEN